jgi:hypothetical protein
MVLYGKEQTVTFKTFLATDAPADGVIRVVSVKRSAELFSDCSAEWVAFFCTDQNVSPEMIKESVADRSAIEQNFHDVKEVHGAGEQQVRNVWCSVACWNLCLWLHTIVELWSWRRSGTTLKQRDDRPWNDPTRRPSHADRLKTLKKHTLCETFSALPRRQRAARKIQRLFQALARLVNHPLTFRRRYKGRQSLAFRRSALAPFAEPQAQLQHDSNGPTDSAEEPVFSILS